jgi:glyoxylase-like metal-dependent hydrolase (beta-lactamase superfamily II)
MSIWLCKTCGAQFDPRDNPPDACPICEDERQFVGPDGQEWIDRNSLEPGHQNDCRELETNLLGIGVSPPVGIGQRALLVISPAGNVLWDCTPMLDRQTRDRILAAGGLKAICCSHPHFYTGMAEWSEALGGVPIHVPEADLPHVTRSSGSIVAWRGDRLQIMPGVVLHRLGGHFSGSSVLEWSAGAEGRGALLVGDTIQVAPAKGWVSFMRSYPNMIPLPAREVRRIANRIAELRFDRMYGGWWDRVIPTGAKQAVARSADRYVDALA